MTDEALESTVEPIEADAPVVDETPEAPPAFDEADAAEARALGWKSADDWKGEKPAGFVDDPTAYLERLGNTKPFRVMSDRIKKAEADLTAREERLRKIETMSERALGMQRQQYEDRISQIGAAQRQAVASGDVKAYDDLARQRDAVSKQMAPAPEQPGPDPYIAQYSASDDGKWLSDPSLKAQGAAMINANPAIMERPAQEQIAYARAELGKYYPHMFPDASVPAPRQAARQSPVEGGGMALGGAGNDGGYARLPSDVKTQFSRFVEQGLFKNDSAGKKDFVKMYNEG